jgi:hypothetical protein
MGDRSISVLRLFQLHWKQILVSLFVGTSLAGALFVVVPQEWEAVAEIQVGQVGHIGQLSQGGFTAHAMPIEAVPVTFERMTSPSFVQAVSRRVGRQSVVQQLLPKRFGGKGKLDVRQPMNSDLIIVRVRAESAELAQQLGEGIVAEITEEHARIAGPIKNVLHPMLLKIVSEIAKGDISGERVQLLISQMEPLSRPTREIGRVVTLAEPVFPRPMYFAALGVLIGIAIMAATLGVGRLRKSGTSESVTSVTGSGS